MRPALEIFGSALIVLAVWIFGRQVATWIPTGIWDDRSLGNTLGWQPETHLIGLQQALDWMIDVHTSFWLLLLTVVIGVADWFFYERK